MKNENRYIFTVKYFFLIRKYNKIYFKKYSNSKNILIKKTFIFQIPFSLETM